ncbi:alanine racemase [Parasphingorhabdus marina DSM 22363]|uniref:alanine racemase n=1 Tax=Parasphingorhabdus marina DSM 22363 TaxID=1123272 RepID=A0A1N6FNN5_9SPHN|nr:alanine racemase [Parasphingorhabdus marina]SIN96861.1 alanine racemase [Parasphingorhabdus marina DSM 22363]
MSVGNEDIPASARLRLDGAALVANWNALDRLSGSASAGAAVKADGYGLGARGVTKRLIAAGCRDFYVANWQEASDIADLIAGDARISVLNGVQDSEMPAALASPAKPVLNSLEQARRWRDTGRPCDLMINSGMNRLGINPDQLAQAELDQLDIDMVMSHLASADEDVDQNADQLSEFREALQQVSARRISFANSAGIALGEDYHFDATRPGLALYGGQPRAELKDHIEQVAWPECQIVQIRQLRSGDRLGYNARYIAEDDHPVAILAMGYADGYLRSFAGSGYFVADGQKLPVLGRISMDLTAVDIRSASALAEGDWLGCGYDLPDASVASGLSQYELLTNLGQRFARDWTDTP